MEQLFCFSWGACHLSVSSSCSYWLRSFGLASLHHFLLFGEHSSAEVKLSLFLFLAPQDGLGMHSWSLENAEVQ